MMLLRERGHLVSDGSAYDCWGHVVVDLEDGRITRTREWVTPAS